MNSPFVRQNNFSHILKVHFYSRKVILRNFSRAEMDFLAMDKIFCHGQKNFVQDNLGFVLDKKYFVCREGLGIKSQQKDPLTTKKTRKQIAIPRTARAIARNQK